MTVIIELDQLDDLFAGVATQFERLQLEPYLEHEFDRLEALHAEYFHRFAGPDREGWAKNSPATEHRKGHGVVLQDSTALVQSLVHRTSDSIRDRYSERLNHGLTYGTGLEYARLLQAGTRNMPARRHIGFTEEYLAGATERLLDSAVAWLAAA